jgi:hypothetical protein
VPQEPHARFRERWQDRLIEQPVLLRDEPPRLARDDSKHGPKARERQARRRDLRAKLQIYARFKVPHYWIADPGPRTIQPYELTRQGYNALPLLHSDDILSCPLFPDITIQVGELFK